MNKGKYLENIDITKILFLGSVLFSFVITYFTTRICIDSDVASELVLAEHLSKTGQILSTDWFYSTELRVINTQLIFAPLFWIFDDWHLVRYFGTLILQGILIASFYCYTKLLGIDKKVFYVSSVLLLLPVSVCYGRIVLYNCYYIPHIALSLFIVGLIFAKIQDRKPITKYVRFLLLAVISFLGGLGGIRQLMMTHIPALLVVFIYYFIDDYINKNNDKAFEKKRFSLMFKAICAAAFSFAGYFVNSSYLAKKYVFFDYNENIIKLSAETRIDDILYGLLHHFGFRDETKLLSVIGVLSALGIVLGIYCIGSCVCGVIRYKRESDVQKALPYMFFISFTTVMLFIFFVLEEEYFYVLYLSPLVVWMIPVFVLELRDSSKSISFLNLRKLIPYFMVATILVNGLVNSAFLLGADCFEQKYEGLSYKVLNARKDISPAVVFLQENGYELGYATFWNSNICTEISNGKIKMINSKLNYSNGSLIYYDWLTLKSNRELQNKKEFLLLSVDEFESFPQNEDLHACKVVYKDDSFVIYDLAQNNFFE